MFLVPLETADLLIMNLFACFARARRSFGEIHYPPALRVIVITLVVFRHSELPFLAYGYLLVELITVVVFGALIVCELRRQKLLQKLSSVRLPIREIFSFSVPLMASNVIGMIGSFNTSIASRILPPYVNSGLLPRCATGCSSVQHDPQQFMPLYMPSASRLFAKATRLASTTYSGNLTLDERAGISDLLATACFARPLAIFLYGDRYASSAPILAILSLGYFFNVIFASMA